MKKNCKEVFNKVNNKKGSMAVAWIIGFVAILFVGMFGFVAYQQGWFAKQTVTGQPSAQQIVEASQEGKSATGKIYVRDLAQTDISTKKAVKVYCTSTYNGETTIPVDGTSSSTTTTINLPTVIGASVKCWAFNSTFQTVTPYESTVDKELFDILIDGYSLPATGKLVFYTDTLATGTGGAINITGVGASTTGSLAKFRYTNNVTNTIYPFAGIYFSLVTSTNVSEVTVNGGGALSMKHSSYLPQVTETTLQLSSSTVANRISSRQDNWDKVFEVTGGGAILLEGGDYVESGTITFKGDGDGCTSTGELVSPNSYVAGYYRSTLSSDILYGIQTDASSSSLINSGDFAGNTFYCTS